MSQARNSNDPADSVLPVWAIWSPVDPAANPLVMAGEYGNIGFTLVDQTNALATHTLEWKFTGSAATGKWKKSTTKVLMTSVVARILAAVPLDRDTCRLTGAQRESILWRGALLQLPATHFGVVAHDGVVRACKFLKVEPDPVVELQAKDALPRVASVAITWDAIFIPGRLPDGTPSPGIARLADIAAGDMTTITAAAVTLRDAARAPTYAIQLPNVQPYPLQTGTATGTAPPPATAASGYGNLIAMQATSALGTQWNVTLQIGSTMIFSNTTVEMKKAGFVTVLSGPSAQRELEWPAPPFSDNGLPIRMTIISGPTAPAQRSGVSGYDVLGNQGDVEQSDLLSFPWLEFDLEQDTKARYDFRRFLESTFNIASEDTTTAKAILRDAFITWARRVTVDEWRTDTVAVQEGNDLLRKIRLVHMQSEGYDVKSLTRYPHGHQPDDIEKERAKQDAERNRKIDGGYRNNAGGRNRNNRGGGVGGGGRQGGGGGAGTGGACYNCGVHGHIARNCPGAQTGSYQRGRARGGDGGRGGGGRGGNAEPFIPYADRECAYCAEKGLNFKGHFSDHCFVKNPGLGSGFRAGGVPLRK